MSGPHLILNRRLHAGPALIGIAVAALSLTPPTAARAQSAARPIISGVVRAGADSAVPVAEAEVIVAGAGIHQLTDTAGRFRLQLPEAGTYQLLVRRFGYRPQIVVADLSAADSTALSVILDIIPTRLATVHVAGRTLNVDARHADAYRRAATAWGDFIFRDEIDRRREFDTESLLDGLPGVRVNQRGIFFDRCFEGKIQVYIDGAPVSRVADARAALQLVRPWEIEMIEVYRGVSRIPAEFLTDACGVIAISTRL